MDLKHIVSRLIAFKTIDYTSVLTVSSSHTSVRSWTTSSKLHVESSEKFMANHSHTTANWSRVYVSSFWHQMRSVCSTETPLLMAYPWNSMCILCGVSIAQGFSSLIPVERWFFLKHRSLFSTFRHSLGDQWAIVKFFMFFRWKTCSAGYVSGSWVKCVTISKTVMKKLERVHFCLTPRWNLLESSSMREM